MKIGFDFDAVLVNSALVLCDILSQTLNRLVLPEEICLYDIQKGFPQLSDKDIIHVIDSLVNMDNTFKIPPYPGALDFLRWYGKSNLEIIIITNRVDLTPVSVYLESNLDKKTFEKIRLFYSKEKGPLSRALGLKYFIEDRFQNIVNLANHGVVPIIFKQNWNKNRISQKSNLFDLCVFVDSWEDIYNFVGCEFFGY
ncbi:MAG: hypothetical protein WC503_00895 [Candidatus Shapirobacteria bacterium]